MLKENYNWRRYWCNADGKLYLPKGYLGDLRFFNPHVVTLQSLADVPCVVLLGGTGHGQVPDDEGGKLATETGVREQGNTSFWFDLGSSSSEDRLIRKIFQDPPSKVGETDQVVCTFF